MCFLNNLHSISIWDQITNKVDLATCVYLQVLTPTQFLISVPVRGLTGYKERRARQWRYYTLSGSQLLSPVREPEKLHQWLELESFTNPIQEWHDARVAIEGDLVPSKVVSIFKEQVEEAIKTCGLTGELIYFLLLFFYFMHLYVLDAKLILESSKSSEEPYCLLLHSKNCMSLKKKLKSWHTMVIYCNWLDYCISCTSIPNEVHIKTRKHTHTLISHNIEKVPRAS